MFPLLSTANVNIDFENAPLNEVAKIIKTDIFEQDTVITNDLLNDTQLVTIKLKNVPDTVAQSAISDLLETSGYEIQKRNGYQLISKKKPPEEKQKKEAEPRTLIYKPQNRSVRELAQAIRVLYPSVEMNANVRQGQGGTNTQNLNPAEQQITSPIQSSGQAITGNNNQLLNDFLVLRSMEDNLEKIKFDLSVVDAPIPQLMIEFYTYEVTLKDEKTKAIDVIAAVLNPLNIGLTIATGGASNFLTLSSSSFSAVVKLLDTDSRFRAISKPFLKVRSGSSADLNIGQEVPILSGVTTTAQGTQTQNIEYRNSGVLLSVKPYVYESSINLNISQELSSFIQTTTGVNNSPTLNKRSLQTQADIKDDEMIILGGINSIQNTNDQTRFVYPVGTSKINNSSEVIILMKATRI